MTHRGEKELMMFDTGKMVTAGDAELFVAEAGRADGPPIILLHGGLRSRADFKTLGSHLCADFRLVAIDSRGHGRSAIGSAAMTYCQLAEDIAALLSLLGLNEAGIMGHSDGAIVALRLAVSRAVQPRFVIAAGARWRLSDNDPIHEICRGISVDSWRQMFPEQVQSYEAENPAPDFARLFRAATAMWLANDDKAYPGDAVSSINSPLLVVHGDEDSLVSRTLAFELAERVEGARLLNLPFASHAVLEDSAMDVLPTLTQFIHGT